MKRLCASLTALLLSLPCASLRAQDPDEAARKAGEAIAEMFKTFDPALCGTFRFGVYDGDKNFGILHIVLDRAPEGSGGAYRCRFEMKGGSGRIMEAVLSEAFGTVSQTDTQSEGFQATTAFRREGGAWTCRISSPGKAIDHHEICQTSPRFQDDAVIVWKDPGRTDSAFLLRPKTPVQILETDDGRKFESPYAMHRIRTSDGREGWVPKERVRPVPVETVSILRAEGAERNYGDFPSTFLLCRALAALGPGRYTLKGIRWPAVAEPGPNPLDLGRKALRDVRIEASEAKAFPHRGREVRAVTVRVDVQGEPRPVFLAVDPDRRVLAIWSEGDGVRMVAGSEEEIKAGPAATVQEKAPMNAEIAETVFKDFYRLTMDAMRAKQAIKGKELMDQAARKHGFKDWEDYCTTAVKKLGAEGWVKVTKEVAQWGNAEMEKAAREMAQGAEKKGELRIAYYEIYQPDVNYPNDDIIIWQAPDRAQRAFLLAPKTRVEVIKTVDGEKYGTLHVMYQIKTADGRTGWVAKPWCKQVYK